MKKLTVRQHAGIQTAFYIIGVILALVYYATKASAAIWLAVVFVIGGVVWRAVFIKCPYCGDGLTGSRSIPRHCPNCGKSLDENPTEES